MAKFPTAKSVERSGARLSVVQALYEMEISDKGVIEALAEFEAHWIGREVEGIDHPPAEIAFFRDLLQGVVAEQRAIDPQLDRALATGWPLKRIEAVLRAILRAGAYELMFRPDVPARAAISEYVDVAHSFYGGDEPGLINAVLDKVARSVRPSDFDGLPGLCTGMSAHGGAPRSSECALIARYFAPLVGAGAHGLADDAASLTPSPGHDLILTADAIVSGIHYLPDDPPASIARKALGVNLSDLAAKGATPRGFLLTLALPDDWTEDWLGGFAQGLAEGIAAFGCPLLGGDTVRAAGPMLVGVTALGEVPTGTMVPRMAARVGDRLCVSGTIGDGALGLQVLRGAIPSLDAGHRAFLIDRYRHPRPRLALTPVLRRYARAAMDVSDGLAGDLAKMLQGGARGAGVSAAEVPLSAAARAALAAQPGLIDTILTGGDDYEILCSLPPEAVDAALAEARAAGVPLSVVGTVTAGEDAPVFRMPDGTERRFAAGSFSHF